MSPTAKPPPSLLPTPFQIKTDTQPQPAPAAGPKPPDTSLKEFLRKLPPQYVKFYILSRASRVAGQPGEVRQCRGGIAEWNKGRE